LKKKKGGDVHHLRNPGRQKNETCEQKWRGGTIDGGDKGMRVNGPHIKMIPSLTHNMATDHADGRCCFRKASNDWKGNIVPIVGSVPPRRKTIKKICLGWGRWFV